LISDLIVFYSGDSHVFLAPSKCFTLFMSRLEKAKLRKDYTSLK